MATYIRCDVCKRDIYGLADRLDVTDGISGYAKFEHFDGENQKYKLNVKADVCWPCVRDAIDKVFPKKKQED